MKTRIWFLLLASVVVVSLGMFLACTGSSPSTSGGSMGTVNLSLSDPPTCAAPSGPYANVWVTVKDVKIHQSSTASPSDSGWVDLTPDLSAKPQQVDLLSAAASSGCFLSMLGSHTNIQAGTYQQIRVYLSDNSDASKLTTNHCTGNNVNCVVLTADSSVHTLQLASEANTGLKIPSGQIAGGQFTIAAGEVKDLNVDFDACASIVAQGGNYRLKPVLHAGEVSTSSASVSGKLVDSVSQTSILGGTAIVALESRDSTAPTPVDRVVMQVTPDSNGNFVLCPVPAGTYDVVAVAVNGAGVAYAASITTGVQAGDSLGNIPMVAQLGVNLNDASLSGTVTSTTAAVDVTLFAMQQVSLGGTNVNVIIPLAQQSSSTASLTTVASGSCAGGASACVDYTVAVPAMWPNIGAYSARGSTYTQSTATPVNYLIGADASSAGAPDCTAAEMLVGPLTVTAGNPSSTPIIAFTGCN